MAGENPNTPEDMSQDDIDAALSAANGASDEGAASESTPEPEGVAADASQPAAAETDSTSPEESQTSGEISQEDIDAALAAATDASESGETDAGAETDSAVPSDGGLDSSGGAFSQDDIDAALAEAAGGETEATEATESSEPALETVNADGSPKLDSQGRPFDEAAAMMEAAIAEERAAAEAAKAAQPVSSEPAPPQELPPPPAGTVPLELPDFSSDGAMSADAMGIALLNNVNLDVKIELGRADMYIEDVLKLGEGSVVELDKLAGDPVDVLVNDRLVARGEVLVLNDSFCVRISEILVGPDAALAPAPACSC